MSLDIKEEQKFAYVIRAQILEILDVLKMLEKAQNASLYTDCYEVMSECIDVLINITGEDFKTIYLAKEYIELLDKAQKNEIDTIKLTNVLNALINNINDELLPKKIKAVFLSYKAAMSDSIESIYLAAKDDPDCDAYWIPIPYYEKSNPQTPIFEGPEYYEKNIICTDYTRFDIKAEKPDVIFTFNPYDDSNLVTSLYPNYFCRELWKHTKLLVYVSYGIEKEVVENDTWPCILPSSRYADKVILESDRVRDIFIDTFKETYNTTYGVAEDKFVALGSPKFDKIINTKRENYNLPDTWCKLIQNKIVILYSNTLSNIGGTNEEMELWFNKLESVFDTFKNRDDVVLWWCPHPHIVAYFINLRQPYYERYIKLVEDYKNANFGIYDDTPDFNRAIVFSDARYSDNNSVSLLYEATGKPLYIQDYNIPSNPWSIDNNSSSATQSPIGITNNKAEQKKSPTCLSDITNNTDGTCGANVWEYTKAKVQERRRSLIRR
ncbi:MAG: hypothetical protein LBC73_02995 [Oscillospiraceae bacterium]|jgi:hypothetical protein|nr:hypothetical protein [Oscillospiraceae bacterium]